jgi:asparagine synthase (glutamine-hydrolysing)
MCGIAGVVSLPRQEIHQLDRHLGVMNQLQRHRGPDGEGTWMHRDAHVGFAHRRLSIIDLLTGQQPMKDRSGNWITYNGEIYNYLELRRELGQENFTTTSDTEVVLQAYQKWGMDCVNHLRGMFAFALWDETNQVLFCARDRFGIKPFYYTVVSDCFYFASEVKALLPFVDRIETDREGLTDYLVFQFCMAGKTLFKGISELLPGHFLRIKNGSLSVERYWEVYYDLDFNHTAKYFEENLQRLLFESIHIHLRSDVPLGTYLSGGLDSSIVTSLASRSCKNDLVSFHGKFPFHEEFNESQYAHVLADWCGVGLQEIDIKIEDFIQNIRKIIYHMDYPAAGPGSLPQYMVSKYASRYRKVLLGGQGGDEIFGGYARYLMAYFEQCIKAAIDGTMHNGNFIVTYESVIPNLTALKTYKPLLKEFWREGLFEDMDRRYFRLINRATLMQDEVNWEALRGYSPFETFRNIFNGDNVRKESYFDLMTHFDFKTLLPALLQVEDRVSMAHGIESRVPFLDHPLVEFAATIPSNIKFKDGTMKQVLKKAMQPYLPDVVVLRKDKMGFPTPLTEWMRGEGGEFVKDIFSSKAALDRGLIYNQNVLNGLSKEVKYGRKIWGLLCLELWQEEFHDKEYAYKHLISEEGV